MQKKIFPTFFESFVSSLTPSYSFTEMAPLIMHHELKILKPLLNFLNGSLIATVCFKLHLNKGKKVNFIAFPPPKCNLLVDSNKPMRLGRLSYWNYFTLRLLLFF